jgi:hypothetical protein
MKKILMLEITKDGYTRARLLKISESYLIGKMAVAGEEIKVTCIEIPKSCYKAI